MSEKSHPAIGPKPLSSDVLKRIVGGVQSGDRHTIDEQTAIGLTVGADEAGHAAPPDAPRPVPAEEARDAAAETKAAPDAGGGAKNATPPIAPANDDTNITVRTTAADLMPMHEPSVQNASPSMSWQAMNDDFEKQLKDIQDRTAKTRPELEVSHTLAREYITDVLKMTYQTYLAKDGFDKFAANAGKITQWPHDDPAHGRVSVQQPEPSIVERATSLSYREFLLAAQERCLSDLRSSEDDRRRAAEAIPAAEEALRAARGDLDAKTTDVRNAEATLAEAAAKAQAKAQASGAPADPWAAPEQAHKLKWAQEDKYRAEKIVGDREADHFKAAQTQQAMEALHEALRSQLDVVRSELEKAKGPDSQAKDHDGPPGKVSPDQTWRHIDHAREPEPRNSPEEEKRLAEEQKQLAEEKKLAGEEQHRQNVINRLLSEEQRHVWYLETAKNDLNKAIKHVAALQKEVEAANDHLQLKTAAANKPFYEYAKHGDAKGAMDRAVAQKNAAEKALKEKMAKYDAAVWKQREEEDKLTGHMSRELDKIRANLAKVRAESAAARSRTR